MGAAGAARPGARGQARGTPSGSEGTSARRSDPRSLHISKPVSVGLSLPWALKGHSKQQADPTWTPTMEKNESLIREPGSL